MATDNTSLPDPSLPDVSVLLGDLRQLITEARARAPSPSIAS